MATKAELAKQAEFLEWILEELAYNLYELDNGDTGYEATRALAGIGRKIVEKILELNHQQWYCENDVPSSTATAQIGQMELPF